MVTTVAHMDNNDVTHQVATAVRERITGRGETQLRVAEVTGIPRATLMRRLSGAVPFDVDELARLAAALDCDITDFVPGAASREELRRTPERVAV